MSLNQKSKTEVLPPRNAIALDTLAGVRGEMARLYRLALNGRIRSDEMTRFIYALKEIRACLEAEMLTDIQQRLVLLSRDWRIRMVTASFISRLSHAVERIEQRIEQNRPRKVVTVRRGLKEDPDVARDRHYAAHPEDRGANIVIFDFYDDEEMAGES